MEYNYEPLLDPKNVFYLARKKLEDEILNWSLNQIQTKENVFHSDAFFLWLDNPLLELNKIFIVELEKLILSKTYFFGCSLDDYKLNYSVRLQSFLKKYYDATEQDFIKYELKKEFERYFHLKVERYDLQQNFETSVINNHTLEMQIYYSRKARNKFLTDKLNITATPGGPENIYLGQPTNETANKLFDYLIEYYRPNEKTSVKYVNILQYLKYDANKDLYIFNIKQKDFKQMIKSKVGIEIVKFQISEKYNEVEKPILNSLETSFGN